MGNSAVKEKSRHFSGDDAGPTMATRSEDEYIFRAAGIPSPSEEFTSSYNVDEPMRFRASTLTSSTGIDRKKLPTVFKWEGGGKEVFISGSFDNWKTKIPMVKSHGDFYTIIDLPEGTHEYKFFVDGNWLCDSKEPKVKNEEGTQNNQVDVKAGDFEVFEALAMDSGASGTTGSSSAISGSPPGEYSQEIPPRTPSHSFHSSGPPILPPHLLQVILNKEIPVHCEPNLLPEPNHVMLNHLYALSIKDGVIVLSATHRYRKKYVTTLLYKPI